MGDKDPIIVSGQNPATGEYETIIIQDDGTTDPEVDAQLERHLEIEGFLSGYTVDRVPAEDVSFAFADAGAFGVAPDATTVRTGAGISGAEQVIQALNSNSVVFSNSGADYTDIIGYLGDIEENDRAAAAAAASSASAAAKRVQLERLALQRDATLKRLTRAEEDRRLEFEQTQQGQQIAAANAASALRRESINANISTIQRRQTENAAAAALTREDFELNRTGFDRNTSLESDPTRSLASSLGATGSPVQVFQQKIRQLELDQQNNLLDNQEERLSLAEQAELDAYYDQLAAQDIALRAETQAENDRILAYITGGQEALDRLNAERAIEDTAENYALAAQTIQNPTGPTASELSTQQTNEILAIINARNAGTPTTTPAATPTTPAPDVALNDAVTNPGTLDDVVNTVVANTGSGSGGLFQ